ncbi:hypothetical protein A3B50_03460 [Candidatus Roizmanbacteria bacterium RIFCSPLOWO2_01_FULL_40_42]|uniref:Cell envelope-related transcriptional attenuator domain-containing protein n=1 Tax=Candidatus Roizmanbacteria bacterium RIFCSPLOWO2_01_FULL_40_42 TaxID=1802066 RepID=A0A1F7J509_9BACT|nr:MAG: hypothetical protein A3B50_03460 [Candidatus Roizmanbacteria bacterium RIFCSPLOWO2_01_FULL_40_42]OGK59387.1 MAG: hypothetical protein A3H84_02885 [Candidatus Roizmanbacteria bacterium RIFCSPLOWO2_02_FULL_40_13]
MKMKNVVIVLFAIVLAAVVFFLVRLGIFYGKIYNPKNSVEKKPSVEKSSYNILLLGYAGGTHEGTFLTDTMIVAHVDLKKKSVVLVSLPRDIWVAVPTKSGDPFHVKINTLYELELLGEPFPDVVGKNLVNKTIENIAGLPIDYFVAIDFYGFTRAMDILGGIDVNVDKSFTDERYPIEGKEKDLCGKDEQFTKVEKYLGDTESTLEAERDELFKKEPNLKKFFTDITDEPQNAFPCRYEKISFAKGLAHMSGETALKYARSRNSPEDGGDFGRARRQQKVIEATKDKVLTIGFVPKIIPLLDELEEYIKTDMPAVQLNKFLGENIHANEYKITNLVLTDNEWLKSSRSSDGQFVLIPEEGEDQWNGVKLWVKKATEGIIITPSPKIKPTR